MGVHHGDHPASAPKLLVSEGDDSSVGQGLRADREHRGEGVCFQVGPVRLAEPDERCPRGAPDARMTMHKDTATLHPSKEGKDRGHVLLALG